MTRSPYDLLREADEKMKTMILAIDREKEERVIVLINAAASFPGMSKYQVMKERLFLMDLYISHGIYGNAYELGRLMLDEYPKAPVKRKLKDMQQIRDRDPEAFVFSGDVNMADPELCYNASVTDPIYDPAFEADIEAQLDLLPDGFRESFYNIRANRSQEKAGSISGHDLDVLELSAMKKSQSREEKP